MFKKRAIGSAAGRRVAVDSLQVESSTGDAEGFVTPELDRMSRKHLRPTAKTDAEARVQTLNTIADIDENSDLLPDTAEPDPLWEAGVLARAGFRSSSETRRATLSLEEAQKRLRLAIDSTEERVNMLEAEIAALDWQISKES